MVAFAAPIAVINLCKGTRNATQINMVVDPTLTDSEAWFLKGAKIELSADGVNWEEMVARRNDSIVLDYASNLK